MSYKIIENGGHGICYFKLVKHKTKIKYIITQNFSILVIINFHEVFKIENLCLAKC